MRKASAWTLAVLCASGLIASRADAVNTGVAGKSITIKVSLASGKSSLKSTQKDPLISYGPAGSAALLSATLDVYYADTPSNKSSMPMPAPWVSNNGITAKYANLLAPAGPSLVKTASLQTAKQTKVTAKSAGAINIVPNPGPNGIIVVLSVHNGVDSSIHRLCTQYSTGLGSKIIHLASASSAKLIAKNGFPVACPAACDDGVKNGSETDVDCGGSCGACSPGGHCSSGSDCTSHVCTGGICQAPSCSDGVKNGSETGVDCGGGCTGCSAGGSCGTSGDCASGICVSGVCKCANHQFTFDTFSSGGAVFSDSSWPGGTQQKTNTSGCSVTINQPNNDVVQVCTIAAPFSINTFAGYSNCFGTGGEDGDGCQVISCPPAGVGSCCSTRPSCSAGLNGDAHAQYIVQCLQ